MRLIVVGAGIIVPLFGTVAVDFFLAGGDFGFQGVAMITATFLLLASPFVLRATGSHVAAGTLFCLSVIGTQFFLATTDSGLMDTALYFAPVVPLVAAFMVGSRAAVLCGLLVLGEVGVLYTMELGDYPFPRISSSANSLGFALLSLGFTTVFCTALAWLYEGYTIRWLRAVNAQLQELQGVIEEREARYRALVQHSSDTITVIDRQGIIQYQSPAVYRNFGYDPDQTLGRSFLELVHPEDQPHMRLLFERSLSQPGELEAAAIRCRHADGRYIYIETVGTNMLDSPWVEGIVFNSRDVTARRQAQEDLRRANERLEDRVAERTADLAQANRRLEEELVRRRRNEQWVDQLATLLEHAQDAIWVLTPDGTIVYWNHSASGLYGWDGAGCYGRDVRDLLIAPIDARHTHAFEAVLAEGEWSGELHQRTRAGTDIVVESRWTFVQDDLDDAGTILVVNTDVTQRKVLLRRAQRVETLGRLAGGVAHDINNVLGPIMMSLELLEAHAGTGDPTVGRLLSTIERGTQRGADLVRQLLAYMRGARGEWSSIAIIPLVDEIESLLRDALPCAIALTIEVDDEVPAVMADPTQLHQVVMNLAVNARDAMPDGGDLRIEVRDCELSARAAAAYEGGHAGRFVAISVSDTGRGIPPEMVARVFEPFFTTKEEGTGIGLATVADIVRSHGGFVGVKSAEGIGTRFDVFLPAAEGEVPHAEAAETDSALRGQGELVLVVDDKVGMRAATCGVLETHGFQTIGAADGTEALAAFAEHTAIQIVLTDMMMPGMDGPALVQALEAQAPGLPVIGMSGLATYERAAEVRGSLAGFLDKPFTAAALLKAIGAALAGAALTQGGAAEHS